MNQLFVSAIAEKLSALETDNMLRERAARDVLSRIRHASGTSGNVQRCWHDINFHTPVHPHPLFPGLAVLPDR